MIKTFFNKIVEYFKNLVNKDLFTKIKKSEKLKDLFENLKLLKNPDDLNDLIKTFFNKIIEYFKNLVN